MAVKILAADDSATMRKVLEMTFAGEAVQIETVGSGEAAVERASASPPDLVIADVSMSMDGYEVARALKSNPATQNVAVIVLASQHHPYDAEKGRACGVDDHVLKPYDTQVMIDKAKDVLSRPRARPAAAAPPPLPTAAAARPAAPPAPPRLPTAPAARAPGVGRPGTSPPSPRSTVAFGAVSAPKPSARPVLELAEDEPPRAPAPAAAAKPAARTPAPSTPAAASTGPAAPSAPAAAASAVAAATAANGDMAARLAQLGLSREQIEGVLGLSREIIERVVWEVVPDLAETIIREEIKRLTAE